MRHAARREALHDRLGRLDLLERDRLRGRAQLEQVAHLHRLAPVDEIREVGVTLPAVRPHGAAKCMRGAHVVAARCRLQSLEHVGVGLVRLAALAELEVARVLEAGTRTGGGAGTRDRLLLQLVEADSPDRPRRPRKSGLDEVTVEAERLEGLRAAVAGDVRDPELRHHLEHAVLDRLLEARLRLGRRRAVAADPVVLGQRRDRLQREPWADGLGSEAEQAREVVHLPRLVALDEQRRERAQSDLDEMVVHDRRREQDRHGRPLGRCVSVGDKEHPVTFTHCGLGGLRDPRAGAGESLQRVEARVDPDDGELVEGGRVEEEALELEARRLLGRLDEQRPTGAEQRRERHREPLADVVDRRIRHLREPLAEVAEERSRTPGERGQRRVIAHRGSRLVSVSGGRTHDHRQLLARVAKENVSCREAPPPAAVPAHRWTPRAATPPASGRTVGCSRAAT